jgi:hypothetical protein
MPLFQLLARTVAALGVKAPGAAQSFLRTKVFEETFSMIFSRSSVVSGRITGLIRSGTGAFSTTKSSSLSNSFGKLSNSAAYVIRYIISDAYVGVMSLEDEDFRNLVLRLRDGDSATDLLEDVDFDPIVDVVDDIPYLRDLVAAGVLIGIIVRLNDSPELLDEYMPEGAVVTFAGANIKRSGSVLELHVGGRVIKASDLNYQPVVMAVLVLRAWEGTDIVTGVAKILGLNEGSLGDSITLSPSLDRIMNIDAADRIFQEVRDAQ